MLLLLHEWTSIGNVHNVVVNIHIRITICATVAAAMDLSLITIGIVDIHTVVRTIPMLSSFNVFFTSSGHEGSCSSKLWRTPELRAFFGAVFFGGEVRSEKSGEVG